jgi:ABC-type methionine transport system ATPase subunit
MIWQNNGARLVKTITTRVIVIVSGKVAGYGEVIQANQRNAPSS